MSFELEQLETKQMMSVTLADTAIKTADLTIYIPPPTPIYVYGTAGNDNISVSQDAGGNIAVNNNGTVTNYTGWLVSNVYVYGYDGNDNVTAYSLGHQLVTYGGYGNDTVRGGTAGDYLYGNDGNDYIDAWSGADYVSAGAGNDTVLAYTGNDTVYGDDGDDKLYGESDNDLIYGGYGNDQIRGGSGSDWLLGEAGNDKIWGDDGDDWMIGGDGDDQLFGGAGYDYMNGSAGNDTLISIGGGQSDTLYGSTGFDSFWADSEGTESVADADFWEIASGNVHRVGSFMTYRYTNGSIWPWNWTYVGVSRELNGQSLSDPINGSNYQNFSDKPLFATGGPVKDDIDQNGQADCYFLVPLSAIAKANPNRIRQHVVELGDGTYAVQFGSTFVRVDGDLPTDGYGNLVDAGLGTGNSLWVAIMEKAWAFYRKNDSDYSSTGWGGLDEAYSAMGLSGTSVGRGSSVDGLWNYVSGELGAGKAVSICTPGGSPNLVGSHCYEVDSVYTDWWGTKHVILRNPWGPNNTGGNPYVDLTATQFYNSISGVESAYA